MARRILIAEDEQETSNTTVHNILMHQSNEDNFTHPRLILGFIYRPGTALVFERSTAIES